MFVFNFTLGFPMYVQPNCTFGVSIHAWLLYASWPKNGCNIEKKYVVEVFEFKSNLNAYLSIPKFQGEGTPKLVS